MLNKECCFKISEKLENLVDTTFDFSFLVAGSQHLENRAGAEVVTLGHAVCTGRREENGL
jgi:hypothetical protein